MLLASFIIAAGHLLRGYGLISMLWFEITIILSLVIQVLLVIAICRSVK